MCGCVVCFCYVSPAGLIPKFYTHAEGACDTLLWFLITNLILVVVCGIFALGYALKKHEKIGKVLCTLTPGQLGNLAVRVALSNVGSVLNVVILITMAISVYSVVNSSVVLAVAAVVVSAL